MKSRFKENNISFRRVLVAVLIGLALVVWVVFGITICLLQIFYCKIYRMLRRWEYPKQVLRMLR